MHYRLLTLLRAHEAGARGGRAYDHVVWSRLEYTWLRAHPPLHVLSAASRRSELPCELWVPLGEDYAGINDRHALMTRRAADAYFNRFGALLSGKLLEVLPCLPCGQSSERYLAATLTHYNLSVCAPYVVDIGLRQRSTLPPHHPVMTWQVCRFPPTAFLSCCNNQTNQLWKKADLQSCYKTSCHLQHIYRLPRHIWGEDGGQHGAETASRTGNTTRAKPRPLNLTGLGATLTGKYPKEVACAALHTMVGSLP